MKYIITEEQFFDTIKKFKKDDVDRGEIGHIIEKLVMEFMKGNLCDVVAIKTNSYYMVLILTPMYYPRNYVDKLTDYISAFLGEHTNVIIQESSGCEKMKEN
jgi:hypothetical protein